MAIHLGRPLQDASCNQPGPRVWKQTWTIARPCRPYSVLLPVGFALPSLLPKPRCALTAPFHPYPRGCQPVSRAVCFLWHFPWGRPRRTLSGTVLPWSPDFPLPMREERPSGLLTDQHKGKACASVKTRRVPAIMRKCAARQCLAVPGMSRHFDPPIAIVPICSRQTDDVRKACPNETASNNDEPRPHNPLAQRFSGTRRVGAGDKRRSAGCRPVPTIAARRPCRVRHRRYRDFPARTSSGYAVMTSVQRNQGHRPIRRRRQNYFRQPKPITINGDCRSTILPKDLRQ